MQKLILGTAQFGPTEYGIKRDGLVSEKELEKIAHTAWDGGIRIIHTSWQYNLSRFCAAIFSKFEKIEKCNDPIAFIWGKKRGICGYSPNDIFGITPWYGLDIFQVPINILDNRFNHLIEHARKVEKEIHARSVFLQGLLLMDDLPLWVPETTKCLIYTFRLTARVNGMQPYEAALGYVLGLDEIDRIIVGVNSAQQLQQLVAVKPLKWKYDFSIMDKNVLDPRKWPKA